MPIKNASDDPDTDDPDTDDPDTDDPDTDDANDPTVTALGAAPASLLITDEPESAFTGESNDLTPQLYLPLLVR